VTVALDEPAGAAHDGTPAAASDAR
jgi:hypothetical protein